MKLGKTSWLLLTIGVFIIMFAGLGIVRYQQVQQQNQLNEELTLAQQELDQMQLEQLSYQQERLERQLSQTLSRQETAKTRLSQPIESIATSSTLFDIATACGVEVTQISLSGVGNADLEDIPCSVQTFTAKVEGDVPGLVNFVTKLNDNIATGVVKSVAISIPEITSETKASANIQLIIYAYQGTSYD